MDMETDPKSSLKRATLIVSLVCAAIGILYLAQAFQYPVGAVGRPGPGAYPLFAGSMLLIGSIGAMVKTMVNPPEGRFEWPKGKASWRVGTIVAASLVYAVGLEYLGHIPATAMVTFASLQAMGLRSWSFKIITAVVMAFGSFFFFATVLRVPLPEGVIQLWLEGR